MSRFRKFALLPKIVVDLLLARRRQNFHFGKRRSWFRATRSSTSGSSSRSIPVPSAKMSSASEVGPSGNQLRKSSASSRSNGAPSFRSTVRISKILLVNKNSIGERAPHVKPLCGFFILNDAPRGAVDLAIRHRLFLPEALRQNLRLNASVRQRGMVFNETVVTGAETVGVFCARP